MEINVQKSADGKTNFITISNGDKKHMIEYNPSFLEKPDGIKVFIERVIEIYQKVL